MLLVEWIILVVAIIISSALTQFLGLKFYVNYSSFRAVVMLFIVAAVLAFLNLTLGTFLKVLALPITILTLGLFALVINAIILFLVGKIFPISIRIENFWAALVGSFFISIVSSILNWVF